MDPAWSVEFRYSTSAKLRDVLAAVLAGTAAALCSVAPLRSHGIDLGPFHVLAAGFLLTMLLTVVLGLTRWGRRARFDSRGLEAQGIQLAWEEVEEIFPRSPGGAEVRGAGRRVLLDRSLGEHDFRSMVAARCHDRLLARALGRIRAGEPVCLPGPWGKERARAAALAVVAFLSSPIVGLYGLASDERYGNGCAVFALLWTGALALVASRRLLWKAGRVEASAEGLRIAGLRAGSLHAWPGLLRIDVTSEGGAILVFGDRESVSIPSVFANLDLLPGLHAALKG